MNFRKKITKSSLNNLVIQEILKKEKKTGINFEIQTLNNE